MGASAIEGFKRNGVGDGDLRCSGGNHLIRRGAAVYWKQTNHEYDEWSSYCATHAQAEASQRYDNRSHPIPTHVADQSGVKS